LAVGARVQQLVKLTVTQLKLISSLVKFKTTVDLGVVNSVTTLPSIRTEHTTET